MAKFKPVRSNSGIPARGVAAPAGNKGFGGLGGGGNMNQMMGQMQKLQAEMEKTTAQLALEEFTGSAGGGMVMVIAAGDQSVKSITIKPEVVNPDDVEFLQDMVTAAVNDALSKARDAEKDRLGSLTGGLGIPGF